MSTYEPGTVAWIAVDGVGSYKALRIVGENGHVWAHSADDAGQVLAGDSRVTDVRVLPVLDLGRWAPEYAAQIPAWLRSKTAGAPSGSLVAYLAEQIEDAVKPPRIPEPGVWGVVEASTHGNADRRQFGRVPEADEQHWVEADVMGWFLWSDLIEPRELRPGIEEAS